MSLKKHARHTIHFTLKDFWTVVTGKLSGSKVTSFEREFAEFIGTKYAVALPSCRFGLYHYLKWLGLRSSDEVIMPAYTFEALPFAILANGASVKYIDTFEDGFNLDVQEVLRAINGQTKAILVSHLYGKPCDVALLKEVCDAKGIRLIEDCAHACGSVFKNKKVGAYGSIGLFSFGVGKGLNANGGGMLTTDSEEVFRHFQNLNAMLKEDNLLEVFAKSLKTYAMSLITGPVLFSLITYHLIKFSSLIDVNYFDELVNERVTLESFLAGMNSVKRFHSGQAALGLMKLRELGALNERLRSNAMFYDAHLPENLLWGSDRVSQDEFPSYYVIRHPQRSRLRLALWKQGIDTKSCDMNVCPDLTHPEASHFPGARKVRDEVLEIPNNPDLSPADLQHILASIARSARELA